jgi:hypothetical protein
MISREDTTKRRVSSRISYKGSPSSSREANNEKKIIALLEKRWKKTGKWGKPS